MLRKEYTTIFALNCILFIPFILLDGVFWDGWTLWNPSPGQHEAQYFQTGSIPYMYQIKALLSLSENPMFFRSITALCYTFISFALFKVLHSSTFFGKFESLAITLLFIALPLNTSKVCITNTNYAISLALFWAGWLVLIKYIESKNSIFRLSALLLFFISFLLNSLIALYSIPLLYLLYTNKTPLTFRGIKQFCLTHGDFILTPLFFLILKSLFLKSSGSFANYNAITFENIALIPLHLATILQAVYIDLFKSSLITVFTGNMELLLIGISGILVFLARNQNSFMFISSRRKIVAIVMLYLITILPYLLVGKYPFSHIWNDRHQTLLPFVFSIATVWGVLSLSNYLNFNTRIRQSILAGLIGLSLCASLNTWYNFHIDWLKELSIVENLKENKEIAQASTIIIDDNTIEMSAYTIAYTNYHVTGLFKWAYGNETRYVAYRNQFNESAITHHQEQRNKVMHNYSDWTPSQPDLLLTISPGETDLHLLRVIKLRLLKVIKPLQFKSQIKDIVSIENKNINATYYTKNGAINNLLMEQ
ncbi:MAG: hypothetical protein OCC49_12370 [Fibrobacterales bacterium]